MSITVTPTQAVRSMTDCIKAKIVPLLLGSPGTGKSDIIRQVAAHFNLFVVDHRLSTSDPTDLTGFPFVRDVTNAAGALCKRSDYAAPLIFPLEGDKIPDGYDGFLLFLDELPSAPLSVQAASYKLILDREIGQNKLHPKCAIIAAGNLSTDGAITKRMGTAMQSRVTTLVLKVDLKGWINHANKSNFDYRTVAWVNHKGIDGLYKFDPNHNDHTFLCPRTLEMVSKLIINKPVLTRDDLPTLAGTISEGPAREFIDFCEIAPTLPTVQDIISNPLSAKLPIEPSTLFLLSSMISGTFTLGNAPKLLEYVERMPADFQVITIRPALLKFPSLENDPAVQKVITRFAMDYM